MLIYSIPTLSAAPGCSILVVMTLALASASAPIMKQAFTAAVDNRMTALMSLLHVVKGFSEPTVPRYVPQEAAEGWTNSQGWTPCSLLSLPLLGPDLEAFPTIPHLFSVWRQWDEEEERLAPDRPPVCGAATSRGLNLVAWSSLIHRYALNQEECEAIHAASKTAFDGTLPPAVLEHSEFTPSDPLSAPLLLDPTHADVFPTVCAFSTGKAPLVWPSPLAQVNHVRGVVRRSATALAKFEQTNPDRWTSPDEHARLERWLELVRCKMLTLAYSRAEVDDKMGHVQSWIAYLHAPTVSQEVRRATVVRLVAPLSSVALKGAMNQDAVAASHWPMLLPLISEVAPEAAAFDRQDSLSRSDVGSPSDRRRSRPRS